VILAILLNLALELTVIQNLVMSWILFTIYTIFAFFIISTDSKITKEREVRIPVQVPVEKEVVRYVDRPVYIEKSVIKEVPIQIPIENETIKVVERPVYIEKMRKKLNIPKYNFLASKKTNTYHKRDCRLSKLIKKKYKIQNNSEAYFKSRKFKGCKFCIKKQVKV
jgi:hypothetical protein